MSRTELIPKVLELDQELSQKKGLPTLYHGKTPQNTVSGRLTENNDKYFLRFIPEGTKKQFFKLAFQPGDFDSAFENYKEWTRKLIELDWPWFFGDRRPEKKTVTKKAPSVHGDSISLMESTLVAQDQEPDQLALSETLDGFLTGYSSFRSSPTAAHETTEPDVAVHESTGPHLEQEPGQLTNQDHPVMAVNTETSRLEHDKDRCIIPTSLDQVLEIKESLIPHSGKGVFARMKIPKHTYLGFYFGVPYDEDEFDSLKEGVGVASQYAHRYKNTVLDATNEQGILYDEVIPELFCPFHYINEDLKKANVAFIDGHVVNQIICMTLKDIQIGEELYVNYGPEISRPWLVDTDATPIHDEKEAVKTETVPQSHHGDELDPEINQKS
jgi:prepilin-type processing-associated H-X9-DG protein